AGGADRKVDWGDLESTLIVLQSSQPSEVLERTINLLWPDADFLEDLFALRSSLSQQTGRESSQLGDHGWRDGGMLERPVVGAAPVALLSEAELFEACDIEERTSAWYAADVSGLFEKGLHHAADRHKRLVVLEPEPFYKLLVNRGKVLRCT